MTTPELQYCLQQLMKRQKGQHAVLACDQLDTYEIKRHPVLLIINNEPSKLAGEHWVAMYIKRLGSEVEFFCSYGRSISDYSKHFTKFVTRLGANVLENRMRTQGPISTTCGNFATFYLYKRLKGCPPSSIYCVFSKNYKRNDKIVLAFTKKLMSTNFILPKCNVKQCCKSEIKG